MGVESLRGGPAETGERPGERGEVSCPGGGEMGVWVVPKRGEISPRRGDGGSRSLRGITWSGSGMMGVTL